VEKLGRGRRNEWDVCCTCTICERWYAVFEGYRGIKETWMSIAMVRIILLRGIVQHHGRYRVLPGLDIEFSGVKNPVDQ
jgi:hypothetical protein